jgi:hypothetical protein
MNLTIQQLLHDFGQFVCIILVMHQQHDGEIASLAPSSFAQQGVIRFRNICLLKINMR